MKKNLSLCLTCLLSIGVVALCAFLPSLWMDWADARYEGVIERDASVQSSYSYQGAMANRVEMLGKYLQRSPDITASVQQVSGDVQAAARELGDYLQIDEPRGSYEVERLTLSHVSYPSSAEIDHYTGQSGEYYVDVKSKKVLCFAQPMPPRLMEGEEFLAHALPVMADAYSIYLGLGESCTLVESSGLVGDGEYLTMGFMTEKNVLIKIMASQRWDFIYIKLEGDAA